MDDGLGIYEECDLKKSVQWFTKNTQQSVMARVSVLPVIARTGPSAKSRTESASKPTGANTFIVGVSKVGGDDRVKGTP